MRWSETATPGFSLAMAPHGGPWVTLRLCSSLPKQPHPELGRDLNTLARGPSNKCGILESCWHAGSADGERGVQCRASDTRSRRLEGEETRLPWRGSLSEGGTLREAAGAPSWRSAPGWALKSAQQRGWRGRERGRRASGLCWVCQRLQMGARAGW